MKNEKKKQKKKKNKKKKETLKNNRISDKPQGRISGVRGGGGGPNRTIHHSSLHGRGEIFDVKVKFSKYGKK